MDTSRIDVVKAPQHRGTPRCHFRDDLVDERASFRFTLFGHEPSFREVGLVSSIISHRCHEYSIRQLVELFERAEPRIVLLARRRRVLDS